MCAPTDHAGIEPRIVATARYMPPKRVSPDAWSEPFTASGATTREAVMQAVYADTLRWRDRYAPFDLTGRSPSQARAETDDPVAAEPHLSASDMALSAARTVLETSSRVSPPAPDQIIVCTTSFEHDLALSCACRLHSELGSNQAPFAIGQLQGVSFLMALEVALAMMAADTELRTILIVAAEHWRPPFSRRIGTLTAMGDGAAVALIARAAVPGWYVRGVTIWTPNTAPVSATDRERIDAAMLTNLIDETCARAEWRPADIDWVLPASVDTQLIREIHTRCGLRLERNSHAGEDVSGHLCAADTPAHLDALWRSISTCAGQRMLVWSAGFQGQAGCALLEFCGDGS